MEEFINKIIGINNPKTIFLLCGLFIFTDVLTGYVKAFKFKKANSSVSRDGYIKKIGWVIAILLGFLIDVLVQVNIFLVGSACVCVATEGMSIYENLAEIGVKLPFEKYFDKLKDKVVEDDKN